jgi:hypothetical protein
VADTQREGSEEKRCEGNDTGSSPREHPVDGLYLPSVINKRRVVAGQHALGNLSGQVPAQKIRGDSLAQPVDSERYKL